MYYRVVWTRGRYVVQRSLNGTNPWVLEAEFPDRSQAVGYMDKLATSGLRPPRRYRGWRRRVSGW